jgi:predicted RNA binding protein YcfA (HicA-like mRNA interferase family)
MVSLTDLTQKQWTKAFKKLGLEIDKKKGKGSHYRAYNPRNGKFTTIPSHCHKFISLALYKQLLEWDFSEEEIDSALR